MRAYVDEGGFSIRDGRPALTLTIHGVEQQFTLSGKLMRRLAFAGARVALEMDEPKGSAEIIAFPGRQAGGRR